jgi:hypothetical protein
MAKTWSVPYKREAIKRQRVFIREYKLKKDEAATSPKYLPSTT